MRDRAIARLRAISRPDNEWCTAPVLFCWLIQPRRDLDEGAKAPTRPLIWPGEQFCSDSGRIFTILRNLFRSEYRKQRREVQDTDGGYLDSLKSPPEQHSRVEFEDFRDALANLPSTEREALLLVGASGFSYEEAAAICKTAVGTIKSRVHRARRRLSGLLAIDNADRFGPDHTTRAILTIPFHPVGSAMIVLDPRM